jgi:hypothetical protein
VWERERERERERDVQICYFYFLKGMMGALAPFSCLVIYKRSGSVKWIERGDVVRVHAKVAAH